MRADVESTGRARRGPVALGRTGVPGVERLHWIDWLRVLAIAGVFAYHTLRPFNTDGWHVKNAETSASLNVATTIFSSFGLAVLFLLAGVGVRYALRKRTWRTFIRERSTRLLVPFAVGTVLLSPFQAYLQASQQEGYRGSYLEYLGIWAGGLPGELTARFAPTVVGVGYHLWFLGFLFAISLVTLPICLALLTARGRAFVDWLARHLNWPAASFVFVAPIYLSMGVGAIFGTAEHDWFEFAWYSAYFLVGFVLLGDDRLISGVRRDLGSALAVAVATTLLIIAGIPIPLGQLEAADPPTKLAVGALFAVEGWAWTLVMLNLGLRTHLLQRPVSERLGDAVLPVYVIHQPVILAVAFVIVTWPLGMVEKWFLLFAVSLPLTLLLVQLALRVPMTRVLLGTRVRGSERGSARMAPPPAWTTTTRPPEVPHARAG